MSNRPVEKTYEGGEFGLIDWIRSETRQSNLSRVGIGDDCALIQLGRADNVLITTDMLMDGRHFEIDKVGAEAAGYKALAVNVSDIAAMAGQPVAAVVAVAIPRSWEGSRAKDIHRGLSRAAEKFDVTIVGGDTNAWDGPFVVSITMFGLATERGAVLRSGAQVGDVIFVTGPLGGSRLGRHLAPKPRVAEALQLNQLVKLHSMIDLSDGLSSDLEHILKASGGLGCLLIESMIPVHDDAFRMAELDGKRPIEHALSDGEDFELCFTVSEEVATRWQAKAPCDFPLYRIGSITREPGFRLQQTDGATVAVQALGFDHFRS